MVRGDVHSGFWWGNLRGEDQLEDMGVDGRIILNRIFEKWDVRRGFRLRAGTGGGPL
jgi:hypothetical protein